MNVAQRELSSVYQSDGFLFLFRITQADSQTLIIKLNAFNV